VARREVTLPYTPRKAFSPFHNRTERWACLVAHRRAGKTVAAINDIVRAALMSKDEYPLYAYIAPYRSQAKSVAWDYLKHFAAPVLKSSNEAELTVELVTGAKIRLICALAALSSVAGNNPDSDAVSFRQNHSPSLLLAWS